MAEGMDIQEIAKIIRKRLIFILIITIISIATSIGINFYILPPIYEAQTQILVNQKSNLDEAYSWQNTETDLRLINTYNVIITSPVILNPVIEQLQLDKSLEQLMEKISVTNENDSKVVNISVIDTSPLLAVEISNMIAEVFKEQIPKLMRVDNISILSEATISANPVKPNKILNVAIGTLIGFFLGIGMAFLCEFLDTTIKTERDVEAILGLPVIGVIGLIKEEKQKSFSLIPRKARRS